jgi:hypothetical protein
MKTKILLIIMLAVSSKAMASSSYYEKDCDDKTAEAVEPQPEVAYYPESYWGQPPAKVTRELVYLQYPHLMPQEDSNDTDGDSESQD